MIWTNHLPQNIYCSVLNIDWSKSFSVLSWKTLICRVPKELSTKFMWDIHRVLWIFAKTFWCWEITEKLLTIRRLFKKFACELSSALTQVIDSWNNFCIDHGRCPELLLLLLLLRFFRASFLFKTAKTNVLLRVKNFKISAFTLWLNQSY